MKITAILVSVLFSSIGLAAEPTSTNAQVSPGMESAPTPMGAVEPGTNPKTGEGAGAITKKPMKPIKHKDLKKDPAAPETKETGK